MRRFTKDHNDVHWLFPNQKTKEDANKVFDEVEGYAQHLLQLGYGNQEAFTRDDMIDAFMKGYSYACQLEGFNVMQLENLYDGLKTTVDLLMKENDNLCKELTKAEELITNQMINND